MLRDLSNKSDRPIVDLFGMIGLIGRSLALPPGVPAAYLAVYRDAFAKMLRDPDYIAEAKRTQLRVLPAGGAELTNAINAAIRDTDPAAIERTRLLTGQK
jgi:tripartite-type tricarboxylate transporter receptor subunit TctC